MLGFIMCMQVHELLAAHDVCLTTPLPTSRPMPKPPGTCERFALSVATVETPP
jgi:hypothetical protein